MRAIIELHCQRIPKPKWDASRPDENTQPSTAYNGEIVLRGENGVEPHLNATFPFKGRELGEVGVWLHYLTRFITMTGIEYCVRMFQKAPGSSRPPVAMDLTPTQVNKIYVSPESATIFFAPKTRTRTLKAGENLQDVIQQEIKNGTREN